MRQQFPMQTKRLGNAVYRCSRDWLGQEIITLAYTGSSPLMQTSSRRLRTARAAVDNTRPRKPAAVLAFDLFWQGGPKTSVAVRTRAASRRLHLVARLHLQRCAVKSTARAAAAYI